MNKVGPAYLGVIRTLIVASLPYGLIRVGGKGSPI
jgi:hypothetical protein